MVSIPFQVIWPLLSSASDLIHLDLWNIPYSGYMSLPSLTQLKALRLGFHCGNSVHRPPPISPVYLASQSFRSSSIIDHPSRVTRLVILPCVYFLGTVSVKVLLPKIQPSLIPR